MTEVPAGSAAPVSDAPAASPNAVPASDTPVTEQATTDPVQAPKTLTEDEHKTLVEKRVNERLSKERRRLEREAKLAAERDFYKERFEQPQRQQQTEPGGKPDPKDFKDWDSYQDAVVDWKLEQRLSKQREQSQRETDTQYQQRQASEHAKVVHETIVSKGRAKYDDFDEVVTADGVRISEPMLAAATKLKAGADVLYHLGQHPDESERIARLSPAEQVWEMRDLESKISSPAKPTQTPPPIVPSASKTSGDKDPKDMDYDDFVKWRKRQIAQRR